MAGKHTCHKMVWVAHLVPVQRYQKAKKSKLKQCKNWYQLMASCDAITLYLYISWRDHPDLKNPESSHEFPTSSQHKLRASSRFLKEPASTYYIKCYWNITSLKTNYYFCQAAAAFPDQLKPHYMQDPPTVDKSRVRGCMNWKLVYLQPEGTFGIWCTIYIMLNISPQAQV